MEYEGGKDSDNENSKPTEQPKLNLSHEDLSDVSDLDSLGAQSDEETSDKLKTETSNKPTDLRHKLDEAKNRKLNDIPNIPEKTSKTEDGEEQLDFEAEDGECIEERPKHGREEGEEIEEKCKEPPEEVKKYMNFYKTLFIQNHKLLNVFIIFH